MTAFDDVARMLADHEGLPSVLAHYALLVGARKPTKDDDEGDKRLLEAARYLEEWLPQYTTGEEALGISVPVCVHEVVDALPELTDFLESQIRAPRKGGPNPDGRRKVCAAVCAEGWRLQHGAIHPYSAKLQEACELYWRSCDNPETSKGKGRLKNWEPFLRWVAKENDEGFREDFLHHLTAPK